MSALSHSLTLRKESRAPLDMLSMMIIIVLPAETQKKRDVKTIMKVKNNTPLQVFSFFMAGSSPGLQRLWCWLLAPSAWWAWTCGVPLLTHFVPKYWEHWIDESLAHAEENDTTHVRDLWGMWAWLTKKPLLKKGISKIYFCQFF